MGKFFKGIVKFTVAAGTVAGLCYVFKDKIKETKVYQDNNMDEKIQKVKTTIKEKMPKVFDNEDDIEEDDLFADDLDLEVEDANRDYVTIDPEAEADKPEDSETSSDDTLDDTQDDSEDGDVPTIEV